MKSQHGLLAFAASVALVGGWAPPAAAQGQDSTPGERSLLIMAELLPGQYDNMNQSYFDGRRKLPEPDRHERIHTTITRVNAPAFGKHVFLWVNETQPADGAGKRSYRVATLNAGPAADEVVMKSYFRMAGEITAAELATLAPTALISTPGCEYVIKTGKRITGVASGEPFWMERARQFHCYVDVPGVGGGRDIPFNRYDDIELHDKGGSTTFRTRDAQPKEIFLRLQSVTWQVLNEANDNFNRNSLVLYAFEKMPDGTLKNGSYVFTDTEASRVGNNLGWMLVNCALTKRNEARPEF